MPPVVDPVRVTTAGPESSPHAEALTGLRADEARYLHTRTDRDGSYALDEGDERAVGFALASLSGHDTWPPTRAWGEHLLVVAQVVLEPTRRATEQPLDLVGDVVVVPRPDHTRELHPQPT